MRKVTIGIIFMSIMFGAVSAGAQSLELDRSVFQPGETIAVAFSAPGNFARDAWVGIIPSNVPHGSEAVNDQHDMTYQYLERRTAGTLTFAAPTKPGVYDFRMHDTDSNGREVAAVEFRVVAAYTPTPPAPVSAQTGLRLEREVFSPGERIAVHFSASPGFARNAWVGIIPSNVPHGKEAVNDQHDMTYQYLEKRTAGTLTFVAPAKPGTYDFRMHDTDDNGRETASVTFRVVASGAPTSNPASAGENRLWLDRQVFSAGESITVHFTASPKFAENAWVGIIPAGVPHGKEAVNDQHDLAYQYLKKRTAGTLVFTSPTNPGAYDFRMHDTDNNGREVAHAPFQVK